MAVTTSNLSFEDIKAVISQLSTQDLITLAAEIDERLQTLQVMKLAETSFQEWDDEAEDIYNVES